MNKIKTGEDRSRGNLESEVPRAPAGGNAPADCSGSAAELLPTATDSLLGTKKWGVGPSAVGPVLRGPWTAGTLANHIWSFAGDDERPDISRTFMQPFVAYTWPSAWTASVQIESR
jgi:hypothetical protein